MLELMVFRILISQALPEQVNVPSPENQELHLQV